jgi:quercetin dioxygenase-like cupin family protein
VKLINVADAPQDIVREPGARQTMLRRLIDTPDGADRFVMSLFELGRAASSPPHHHDWEHEVFVVSGSPLLDLPTEKRTIELRAGDVVFIPRGEAHGFRTGPDAEAALLCVAPTERPPVRSVFLSDQSYEYEPASEAPRS